jgi:hypothetical protein
MGRHSVRKKKNAARVMATMTEPVAQTRRKKAPKGRVVNESCLQLVQGTIGHTIFAKTGEEGQDGESDHSTGYKEDELVDW